MSSRVDIEYVQGDGTLSARGQVDESLDDLGPKAEVLQLRADFDTGQVKVVLPPLDVHDANQVTAHLNDLSTFVLHPRLMKCLLYVLVPRAVNILDVRPHRRSMKDVKGIGVADVDGSQLEVDHMGQYLPRL
jgi:hypothetical protein